MIYCGIDPGITGALVGVDEDKNVLFCFDTPSKKIKEDGNRYDGIEMGKIIRWTADYAYLRGHNIAYIIERVGVMPRDGRVAAFSFGEGFGLWKGTLNGAKIPYGVVLPIVWKRSYGLIGKEKNASTELARQLYPEFGTTHLKRIKDHNRAEALLLARYGCCLLYTSDAADE